MYSKIILKSFDTIFKNFDKLALKLFIPTVIISIINFFMPDLSNASFISDIKSLNFSLDKNSLIAPLLIFILLMTNISIAVTTHRVTILGVDSVPKFGSYIFGLREFKLLFKTFLFAFIIAIPTVLVALIPIAGIFIAPVLALILVSRLSLVFPATSCDEKFSFLDAWKSTKKYKILTILMVIIFPLVFSFSVGFVYSLAIEFLIKLISPNLFILYSILDVFITVFCISVLSSVYDYIRFKPLNRVKKDTDDELREILTSSRKNTHKVIIHDKHKTDFESLKKELTEQYKKLGFTQTVYDRSNSWILKNDEEDDAYVSLRYDNDEYTIFIKNSVEPILKLHKS